jgi:hypothetical protein
MFRMILDIILDIINRRVMFQMKQVNLTELQAFWCNSFGAQPVLPRIQPENFQDGDPFAGLGIYRPTSMFPRQKCREKAFA